MLSLRLVWQLQEYGVKEVQDTLHTARYSMLGSATLEQGYCQTEETNAGFKRYRRFSGRNTSTR